MRASHFIRSFLLIFAGPIIWALHFLFIYGLNGVLCARPAWQVQWLGASAAAWGINIATAVSVLAIVAIHWSAYRRTAGKDGNDFNFWLGAALGAASILAILFETAPVFLVPQCR